jgi:RNA polymerase sigma factor (TIGR02999 family)
MQGEITHGLNAAAPQVPAELYASLRRLAQHHLLRQQGSPTLTATGLVHDAWLKLAAGDPIWHSRQHFVATMAKVMRHVLVDHARARQAERRGGDLQRVTYSGIDGDSDEQFEVSDLVAIDQALERLRAFDPRLEQVFELRFFAGLTIDETAETLALSAPTVKRDLRAARAFIVTQLQDRA